jgi:predicted DNA-binding transcriptional regulator AlpA
MTPTTLPSTREVLALAAQATEHRSADIVLTLAELEQKIGWADVLPGLCAEHQAAVNRLAELHLLIDQLAANLRGGHGVPATPAQPAARRGMPPVTHAKPQQRMDPRRAAPAERADGLVNVREAQRRTGFSQAGFYMARQDGRVPEPHLVEGRSPYWRPEQLEGVAKHRNPATTTAQP